MQTFVACLVVLVRKAQHFLLQGDEMQNAPQRLRLTASSADHHHSGEQLVVVVPPQHPIYDIWNQMGDFFSSSASQILDRLWLGNALNAADAAFLRRVPVRAVVNLSAEVPNLFEEDVLYCQCNVSDIIGCTLPFTWISRFIHAQLTRDRAVLVHCFIGRSRSVAAVCHYLMAYCGYSFDATYAHVSRRRPMACINADLARQLRAAQGGGARARRLSLPGPPLPPPPAPPAPPPR